MNSIIELPGLYEPLSALSHLIGSVVFAAVGFNLYRSTSNSADKFLTLLYVFVTVNLLMMSGVYHALPHGEMRELFRRIDHASIFLLIAGSYCIFQNLLFSGLLNRLFIASILLLSISGAVLKIFFFEYMTEAFSFYLYMVVGLLGWLSGFFLIYQLKFNIIKFIVIYRVLLAGALCFVIGANIDYFNMIELVPGIVEDHGIFHLFVLAGLGFHYRFVFNTFKANKREPIDSVSLV